MSIRSPTLLFVLIGLGCSGGSPPTAAGRQAPTPAHEPPAAASPAGPPAFERFRIERTSSGCPPQGHGDCASFAELLADGTLRMDPWGEPGVSPLTARLPSDELDALLPSLTAEALVTALDRPEVCARANATESMLVRLGGTDHAGKTGYCNTDAVLAARAAILRAAQVGFPNHSLIEPPF